MVLVKERNIMSVDKEAKYKEEMIVLAIRKQSVFWRIPVNWNSVEQSCLMNPNGILDNICKLLFPNFFSGV